MSSNIYVRVNFSFSANNVYRKTIVNYSGLPYIRRMTVFALREKKLHVIVNRSQHFIALVNFVKCVLRRQDYKIGI